MFESLRKAGKVAAESQTVGYAAREMTLKEMLVRKADELRAEAMRLEGLAQAMQEPIYPPEADATLRNLVGIGLYRPR